MSASRVIAQIQDQNRRFERKMKQSNLGPTTMRLRRQRKLRFQVRKVLRVLRKTSYFPELYSLEDAKHYCSLL